MIFYNKIHGEPLMIVNLKCVGCAQCIVFCPKDAIEVKGKAYINENCIRCKICISYCPVEAIEENI